MVRELNTAEPQDAAANALMFLVRRMRVVLIGAAVGLVVGLILAFTLPVKYRAEVKLIAVDAKADSSMLSDMVGRLGGLASLAGLNIQDGSSGKNVTLEVLRSRSQARRFIQKAGLVEPLLKRESAEERAAPNDVPFRALRRFHEKVMDVSEDKRSGIITVAMTWRDPEQAARWANEYVDLFNSDMRARAAADAQRNVQYLEKRLQATTDIGVRQALHKLMEVELKGAMLADVRSEYAAKVIDRATAPDPRDEASPKRALVVGGCAAAGVLLGMLFILVSDALRRLRQAPHSQR